VSSQRVSSSQAIQVPNLGGVVSGAGDHEVAARVEAHSPYGFRVVCECVDTLLGFKVPNFNGAVTATSGEHFATSKREKKLINYYTHF